MVEYVVRVKPELRLHALGDFEVLHQRHIVAKETRSVESIHSRIADRTASWQREGAGNWTCQGTGIHADISGSQVVAKRGHRYEVIPDAVDSLGPDLERPAFDDVRPARSGVGNLSAFADRRSPRQAAAPVESV